MSNNTKLDAIRRGRVLQRLAGEDPYNVSDSALLIILKARDSDLKIVSLKEVRQILKYLQGHGLCVLQANNFTDSETPWISLITSQGLDYLSGISETIEGVERGC